MTDSIIEVIKHLEKVNREYFRDNAMLHCVNNGPLKVFTLTVTCYDNKHWYECPACRGGGIPGPFLRMWPTKISCSLCLGTGHLRRDFPLVFYCDRCDNTIEPGWIRHIGVWPRTYQEWWEDTFSEKTGWLVAESCTQILCPECKND